MGLARALLVGLASATLAGSAYAQGATLTGTVKSEQGVALEGANVTISELNVSVGTNAQGVYRVALPAERVRGQQVMLRVRAIGFQPQGKQITIAAGTITQDFTLKLDVNKLSEVVITGVTGATETKKLAFTVAKIDVSDMPVPAATSALTGLQGKITGAQIVLPSGRPGASPSIVLRGPKSIDASGRSQAPLIIVDGVLSNGSLSDINPQDIESIEVVKGAAASSTYGSRAGNGVIQITTKSGKNATAGTKFNLRSEFGVSDIQSEYPGSQYHAVQMDENNQRFCIKQSNLPDCYRTVDIYEEALRVNQYGPQTNALAPYNFVRDFGIGATPSSKADLRGLFQVNTWPVRYNPVAQAITTGMTNTSNLDMSGRIGQNTGFFASANNTREEGSIRFLRGFTRNSARLNLDHQINDDWSTNLASFYSKNIQYNDGAFFRLTRQPAFVNLLREDVFGRLFVRSDPLNQGGQNENPLYDNQQLNGRTNADRYLASLSTRYTPFSWLEVTTNSSLDRRRNSQYTLVDRGFRQTAIAQGTEIAGSTGYLGNLRQQSGTDQSYNFGLVATARQANPLGVQDLAVRYTTAYTFESQFAEDLDSGTRNTFAVPGLINLTNATVAGGNPASSTSTQRAIGLAGSVAFDYKGRYIADAAYRRDGSSLFGADERWHPYYRASLAWRLSEEGWWPAKGILNDFKIRGSYGTAGGRPRFSAQYETFTIGTGGTLSANTLGNRKLKPETTGEGEVGFDAEILNRYGLTFTYAHDVTSDEIIQVPPSVSSGFSNQWKNAGTMDNKTYEVSLNVPLITNRSVTWTSRLSYDRNRSVITGLGVPPFFQSNANSQFRFGVGERVGTIWGRYFVTQCGQLPAPYSTDCGPGKAYQKNSDGYVVWTGGHGLDEGVTKNLWQAVNPGCLVNGVPQSTVGAVACKNVGGTINNAFGVPFMSWGMIQVLRDSTGTAVLQKLGNTQPDFHLSLSQNFNYKRLSLYALLDGMYGLREFNQEVHWSLGDFMVRYEDQEKQTVATAKPIGYYWRVGVPGDNSAGVGGFYDVLGSNNQTVQKASYTKLREVSATYALGSIRGVGDWSLSVIGRNLWTITDFLGWDPEVGGGGTNLNSDAVGGTAAFQSPQRRTWTLSVGMRF